MDLAYMLSNEPTEDVPIYFVVSGDADFTSMVSAIKKRFECDKRVNLTKSIEAAYLRFFMFKAGNAEHLLQMCRNVYGKELGNHVCHQ